MEYNGDFLTAKEVSKHLRIPLRTVHRLSKSGKIKAVKIGKQWRYKKIDIENYFSFGTVFSKEPARRPDNFSERRIYPRINTNFPCEFSVNLPPFKNIHCAGIIKNLSAGGVLFIGQEGSAEIGDPVSLQFMNTRFEGRLVRKENNECGIKFRNISAEVKDRIINYVG